MSPAAALPHDKRIERALLGGLFVNPDRIGLARKLISPNDFYEEPHQILFQAMLDHDGPFDPLTIKTDLTKKDQWEKAGGEQYVFTLADAVSTSAGVEHHAKEVKELADKRRLMDAAKDLLQKAGKSSSEDLADSLRKTLSALEMRNSFGFKPGVDLSNVYPPEKCLEEYSDYTRALNQNRFNIGIIPIDKLTRGAGPGEVLVTIGRPGTIKTGKMQNTMRKYLQHSSNSAVFFSLEMPISNITERFQTIVHGSTGKEIEQIYRSNTKEARQIREDLDQDFVEELKGLFIVPSRVSLHDITAYVKLIEKHYKTRIGVIGIDYLGLMDGPGKGEYERMSELARGIKNMAKALNIPVVVIAQTNRQAGSDEVEISMNMARGSGAIEEAADFVLGLYQAERKLMSVEAQEPRFDLICKILKNRKGPAGSRWKLDLDPENLRIGPDAEPWEPPKKKWKGGFDG